MLTYCLIKSIVNSSFRYDLISQLNVYPHFDSEFNLIVIIYYHCMTNHVAVFQKKIDYLFTREIEG